MKRMILACLFAILAAPVFADSLSTTTCPGAGCDQISTQGAGTIGIQISGTFSGTLAFEASNDDTTWSSLTVYPIGSTTGVTSTTSTGLWTGTVAGFKRVRVRFSAFTSGVAVTSTVTAQAKATQPLGSTLTTVTTITAPGELRISAPNNIRIFSTAAASVIIRNSTDTGNLWSVDGVGNMTTTGTNTLSSLAAPAGHTYFVCINEAGLLSSRATACPG